MALFRSPRLINPRIAPSVPVRLIRDLPRAVGLRGYWPLADARDYSRAGNNGTISGATIARSPIGPLFATTGTQYIDFGPATLAGATSATIVCNVALINATGGRVMSKWENNLGADQQFLLLTYGAGSGLCVGTIFQGTGGRLGVAPAAPVDYGGLHRYMAVWPGGSGITIYIDGQPVATTAKFAGNPGTLRASASAFDVGYEVAETSASANQIIGNIAMWDRALTASEAAADAAEPFGMLEPDAEPRLLYFPSGYTAALTGISTTGSLGTLGVTRASPLAQIGSTASLGAMAPGIARALTQIVAAGTTGTITTSRTVALQGLVATSAAGTLKAAHTHALTGVAASGSVGTLAPSLSVAVAGVAATGSVGYMLPSFAAPLTGASVAASLGTLGAALTLSLSGVVASGTLGVMQVAGSHDVTVALSGISTVGSVGSMSAQTAAALSGLSASGALGSLGVDFGVPLSGLAATTYLGNLTVHGAILYVAPFRVLIWPMERRILAWPAESRVLTWPAEHRILRMKS